MLENDAHKNMQKILWLNSCFTSVQRLFFPKSNLHIFFLLLSLREHTTPSYIMYEGVVCCIMSKIWVWYNNYYDKIQNHGQNESVVIRLANWESRLDHLTEAAKAP